MLLNKIEYKASAGLNGLEDWSFFIAHFAFDTLLSLFWVILVSDGRVCYIRHVYLLFPFDESEEEFGRLSINDTFYIGHFQNKLTFSKLLSSRAPKLATRNFIESVTFV